MFGWVLNTPLQFLYRSHSALEFVCLDFSVNRIGKTEASFYEGPVEHSWSDKKILMKMHRLGICYKLE